MYVDPMALTRALAGQLSALPGLRALRHLDLQLEAVREVLHGDAEATRGHLRRPFEGLSLET